MTVQAEEWALTEAQRQETVDRMAKNISAMAFFRGAPIPDDVVSAAAAAVEKKAYTVARVEARTTTGVRCGRSGQRHCQPAIGCRRRRCLAAAACATLLCTKHRTCADIAGRTTRRSRPTSASCRRWPWRWCRTAARLRRRAAPRRRARWVLQGGRCSNLVGS